MPDRPDHDPAQPPDSPAPHDRRERHAFMHGGLVSPPGFDRYFTPEELMAIPMEEIEAARVRAEAQAKAQLDAQAKRTARKDRPPPAP
ncbi:MAG: hypothetical protein KIT68_08915 [Phycisphaeraceae bacterium]|nr:hypothetical protein [Phycisphaeraceae bacterium]